MYKKILVVVDEREISQSAIDQGIALARVHRADILFFYVLPEGTPEEFQRQSSEQASQRLAAASAQAERAGVHSHRAMGTGTDDAHCVAEAATQRHCDLIVVATEEKNAVVRLLTGSIVPGLISAATVPLLICRAKTVRAATPRLRVGHKPRT
jgi:nucleotide-binding universal stress UspA family protein